MRSGKTYLKEITTLAGLYPSEEPLVFTALVADAAGERELFVDAFATAVRDNAWNVKENLHRLPKEWQNDIQSVLKPDDAAGPVWSSDDVF
jgi:hypothetical protein